MKKIPMSAAVSALTLLVTACGGANGGTDASPGGISESPSANVSDAPAGNGSALPEGFSVSDYITDFDDAPLIGCSYINDILIPQADEEAVARAVEAYKGSELYSEALGLANEMFRVENGGLAVNDGSDAPAWLLYGYGERISVTEESALDFRCDVISSVRYALDGENEESIVLLCVPLPLSRFDSSAHAGFHVPVYVNSRGEAHILYDVCRQDYGLFKLIAYSNGAVHALFRFGHNESGQQGAVYSFKNGAPRQELSGCPISVDRGMLMGGFGWNTFEPFMLNGESGEFCALKAVPPGGELAEIICSDSTILTYVPNAREAYQNKRLRIIGGKYITFCTGEPWNDYTFVYNEAYKCFERVEPVSAGGALPEQITRSYNIKL